MKINMKYNTCPLTMNSRFDNLYSSISTRRERVLTGVNIMLTARQLLIFKVITDYFIESAHSVGSRAISEKKNISLSSTKIRNVMYDLEDIGLLETSNYHS